MSTRIATLILLLFLLLAGGAAAQTVAVGGDGAVHELVSGFYRAFYPDGDALAPTTPVLALVTKRADGTKSVTLAPESDGLAEDLPRLLLHDAGSGVLTAVWESSEMPDARTLRLAHFLPVGLPSGWTQPRVLVSGRLADPAPRVALSRDRHDFAVGSGQQARTSRTVVHVVWQETGAAGTEVLYTPVVLVEGLDVGWSEVFSLSDLAAARLGGLGGSATPAPGLRNALAVETAADGRALNVAFAEPLSGRLAALRVGVLPLELTFFSGEVHGAAEELAPELDPADLAEFAEKMRAHIIPIGVKYQLQPEVVDYVATRIDAFILETGATFADGHALADALRAETLGITAGLLSSNEAGEEEGVIEIDLTSFLAGGLGGQTAQLLDLRVAGSWPLPAAGDAAASIVTSADGRDLIVAWPNDEGTALSWVETTADGGWSASESLGLAGLGTPRALGLLRDRVR